MLPWYPKNEAIESFLVIVSENDVSPERIKRTERAIYSHQGEVGRFKDWKNPSEWIPNILRDIEKETALLFWRKSDGLINPRYIGPIRKAAEKKRLVKTNVNGYYSITERGLDFVNEPTGETVREIDLEEGFVYMLFILAERPGLKAPDIISSWSEFVKRVAPKWKTKKSIADLYRRRISNLRDRGMAEMRKFHWFITEKGESYLSKFNTSNLIPLRPVDTPETEKEPRVPKVREASDHDFTQLRLVELGNLIGYAVYVARSDKSKTIGGIPLAKYALETLPAAGLSKELEKRMVNIDLIWFNKENLMPIAFIEIETSTGFTGNLRKINDLLSKTPPGYVHSAGVYIIGYDKDRGQAEEIMFGPTFAPLERRCREYKFISVEEVANEYENLGPRLKRESDKIDKAKEEIQKRRENIKKLRDGKFTLFALS